MSSIHICLGLPCIFTILSNKVSAVSPLDARSTRPDYVTRRSLFLFRKFAKKTQLFLFRSLYSNCTEGSVTAGEQNAPAYGVVGNHGDDVGVWPTSASSCYLTTRCVSPDTVRPRSRPYTCRRRQQPLVIIRTPQAPAARIKLRRKER